MVSPSMTEATPTTAAPCATGGIAGRWAGVCGGGSPWDGCGVPTGAHPAVARRPTRSTVARLNESTPSWCAALVLTDCPFALSQRPGRTRDEAAGRLSARWQLIDRRPHLRTHGLRPETGRSYGRKSPPLQNVAVNAQNPENTVPAFVTVYAEFKNARMPPAIWPED